MGDIDFRTRERIVLFAGAAAVSLTALTLLAVIAGHSPGSGVTKLDILLVAFYLCARIAAHAKTLEERGDNEGLARFAWIAAPVLMVVLLLQTVRTAPSANLTVVGVQPTAQVSLWLKVELTTDILLFALFLATCMAVWAENGERLSASVTRISFIVLTLFTLGVLGAVWGMIGYSLGAVRLLASLFVLAFAGWLLVAILRRIERLDQEPPSPPAATTPAAPVAPVTAHALKPQP